MWANCCEWRQHLGKFSLEGGERKPSHPEGKSPNDRKTSACNVTKADAAVSCRALWAGAIRKNIQRNPRLELHISPSSLLALHFYLGFLNVMATMKATLTLGDHTDLFSLIQVRQHSSALRPCCQPGPA